MLVKAKVYSMVQGFDEENLAIAFNDVDFCLRLKEQGFRNVWTPFAELYHHESKSRGEDDHPDKLDRFNKEKEFMFDRWGPIINNDPAYSPNLTLNAENFSLSFPPRTVPLTDFVLITN